MKSNLLNAVLKNRVFWYLFSRYATFGLQFLTSIYIAVKLGVYYFGIWSFILLLVNIGSSCNWGIGNAATILLVQHKEDQELCNRYTYNALILVLLTFILPLLTVGYDRLIGIPIFAKYHLNNLIYAVVTIVLLQYICNFFINVFRVKNKIVEIIIQQSLWPVCMFFSVFCAKGKELLTLLTVSYILALIIPVIIFLCRKQVPLSGKIEKSLMSTIARKGFYLFAYNACFLFIVLTTKLQISCFYSVKEFGYFAFSFSLAQGVILLLDSILFLIFPKTIDMLKGDNKEEQLKGISLLRDNYILPLHFLFYTVLTICPLFFHFIQQYSNSLRCFVLILCTLLMYSHCFGYNSYLLAQNKEKQFSFIVFGALILNNLIVYAFIWFNSKFELAILGTLLTYIIYSVTVNCYALYCLKERNLKIYIQRNFPLTLSVLYFAILCTTILFDKSERFFIIPLILFILLNINALKKLFKGALMLLKNDKIINV